MKRHPEFAGLPALGDLAKLVVGNALERAAAGLAPGAFLLAVDATCGNGHDTLFLAQTLRRLHPVFPSGGMVLAFDIQAEARENARRRLDEHGLAEGVRFIPEGHETLAAHLPAGALLGAIMYNLGFLPGSNRLVTTGAATTLASLAAALEHLLPGGVCAVHAYGGHAGGAEELRAVEAFFAGLPFDAFPVARYAFGNKARNPETLFLAEKR